MTIVHGIHPKPPLLVLAAALNALFAVLLLQAQAYQVDFTSRRPQKSSSRLWASRGARRRGRRSPATPLRAYTVADTGHGKSWLPIFKFPTSFADLTSQFGAEDSLFSFEGGGATTVATKPYMPNLELEAAAIMATQEKEATSSIVEKDELLLELTSLTKKFEELQSSMDYKSQLFAATIKEYEHKTSILADKNALLEEGLSVLTANLDEQEQQLKTLQLEKEHSSLKETDLVSENEILRRRLRELELAQSDAAFLSRKAVPPTPAMTTAKLTPKAPSAPVPLHTRQQYQVGQVRENVDKYQREQSSVLKLCRLRAGRGMKKVGRALNLWSPLYNIFLWGELKGN